MPQFAATESQGQLALCHFSENQCRDSEPLLSKPKEKTYQLIKTIKLGIDYLKDTLFFFSIFGHTCGMKKSPGQGSNPHYSSNPSPCSDNARSLTCCITGELLHGLSVRKLFTSIFLIPLKYSDFGSMYK